MRKEIIFGMLIIGLFLISISPAVKGTVSKSFNVGMSQIQECTPGSKICSYSSDKAREIVKMCNAAGLAYDVVETCAQDEECDVLEEKCVKRRKGLNLTAFIFIAITIALFLSAIILFLIWIYTKFYKKRELLKK